MKKNRLSFFILLSILICILVYVFLAIDPLQLNLIDFGQTSASGDASSDKVADINSGILRSDFEGQAPTYESAATTAVLDYVDKPMVLDRVQALERILSLSATYPEMMTIYNHQEEYDDTILIALANNPEMLEYALHYNDENQTVTGFYTEDELNSDYPLFLQWDYRWGYMEYGDDTVGTVGCGPSTLAMAIYYLTRNEEVTPDVIAQYSMEHRYYVNDIGTSWLLFDHYPTLYGLTVDHIYRHEPYFKAELDKGNILICSVKAGEFTYGGHFIVIYGYDENGFKINDPKCAYRSTLTWPFEQFRADIRRTWSIGKPE